MCLASFVSTDVLPGRLVSKGGLENLSVASVLSFEQGGARVGTLRRMAIAAFVARVV